MAVQQVATDAFGNALGSSLAEANSGSSQQDNPGSVLPCSMFRTAQEMSN